MQMKRRRVEIATTHVPEAACPSKVSLVKQGSRSCFTCGECQEGCLFDSICTLNALPFEPQVSSNILEPTALLLSSTEGAIASFEGLLITNLLEFANPCHPFEFNVISSHTSVCWEDVSRNLQITAQLAGGRTLRALSLRASSSCSVLPNVDTGSLSITISPAWWSHAKSFTIVGLYYAGHLVDTPLLPATITVIHTNHAPSKAGRLLKSTKEGNLAGVISAIKDGCSTEESDNKVCNMIFLLVKDRYTQHVFFHFLFQGETPLHLTAAAGREDIIQALIAAGANVDALCKVLFVVIEYSCSAY